MSLASWWKKRQERKREQLEKEREAIAEIIKWHDHPQTPIVGYEIPKPRRVSIDDDEDILSDIADVAITGAVIGSLFSGGSSSDSDSSSGSGLSDSDSFSGGGGTSGGGGAGGDW